ncbi:MAG TPA: hypothetical protein VI583_08795, partial [Cyclobacteriaceae bacterium]|nr:hypothetical protein [Cyclobacteriaceae bacterium]
KESKVVLGPLMENLSNPFLIGDYVLYNSPFSGIDNIYAIDLNEGSIFQVTSRKFGAYNPVVSGDGTKILFSDFGMNGMEIAEMKFNPHLWKRLSSINAKPENYFLPAENEEPNKINFVAGSESKYPQKPYKGIRRIFNPYSWGPTLISSDPDLLVGVHLQDITSTTAINAGYEFNAREYTGKWMANLSYQGIFPVINVVGYSGKRSIDQSFPVETSAGTVDSTVTLNWNETGVKAGVVLPLNLTHSKYFEYLDIADYANYNHIQDYNYGIRYPFQQGNGTLISNSLGITYQRILRRSKRDIHSRFAQLFYFQYDHTPLGGDYQAELAAVESRLFFPGIGRHHSFNIRLGALRQAQANNVKNYEFSSPIFFPRGYRYRSYQEFFTTSANYTFPIAYPDFHAGPFFNLQRIYSNLFLDYGYGRNISFSENLSSFGAEVYFDFNLMRFISLFNIGIRYTYIRELRSQQFRILIGRFGF